MSSSHVCFSALLAVYMLALSALARWASVRLLSSTASRSMRARASSFLCLFSCAFCALVSGATIVVLDLFEFANGQLMTPPPPPPPPPELCVENDERDGDEGVDGGHSNIVAAVVGVGKSGTDGEVVLMALSSTLVTVPVGECVSER